MGGFLHINIPVPGYRNHYVRRCKGCLDSLVDTRTVLTFPDIFACRKNLTSHEVASKFRISTRHFKSRLRVPTSCEQSCTSSVRVLVYPIRYSCCGGLLVYLVHDTTLVQPSNHMETSHIHYRSLLIMRYDMTEQRRPFRWPR